MVMLRSAGFQTCRIANFQIGTAALWPADLELRATLNRYPINAAITRSARTL
jgi:hypothetical protein